jgi:hypothetical protein
MSDGLEASRRRARHDGILTLIFCWKLVPETKGKRLGDIQAIFQARVDSSSA